MFSICGRRRQRLWRPARQSRASDNTMPACDTSRPCPRKHNPAPGHQLRVRALAARARAVNGNDNVFHSFFCSRQSYDRRKLFQRRSQSAATDHSANNSFKSSFRPVLASRIVAPKPFGGGAASFWKKFGNVFFTQAGFLILMPGTFNPRTAKHIAMRWSLWVSISAP